MPSKLNRGNCPFLLALAALLGGSRFLFAATDFYVGAAGTTNWSVTSDWSLSHPPATGDDATLSFSDAMSRVVDFDVNSNTIGTLLLNQAGVGTLTFQQSANTTLTTDTTQLDIATFNQSNGTHITNNLNIASSTGPVATYNLSSSGKIVSPGDIRVGDFGSGNFTQSGTSSVTFSAVGAAMLVGVGTGNGASTGNYSLTGGSITANATSCNIYIGYSDRGNFDQEGGAILFSTGGVIVGHLAGSTGNYTLNGGTLNAGALTVGDSGVGQVTQSAAAAATVSNLTIASNAGVTGSYSLAGSLTATIENIGLGGSASFSQSGGNHTVSTLTVGVNTGSTGSYLLSAGNLSAVTENIGLNGLGSFAQTGGTNAINASGTLNIGTGFNSGAYNLAGGTLSLGSSASLNNSGTFTITGGVINNSGDFFNNSLFSGFGSVGVLGNLTNAGTITQSGGTLGIAVVGAFTNAGTLNAALPGQIKLNGALTNSGTINLNGGSLLPNGSAIINNNALIVGPGTLGVGISSFSTGIISVPAGTTNISTSFTNAGLIELTTPTSLLVVNNFTSNGTIQGAGTVSSATSLFNNGAMEALGGTLAISAPFFNNGAGTLRVSTGNKLVISTGLANNNGIISLTGGTFDNNNFPMTNNNNIAGFGTLATGGLTNNGNITLSGGFSTVNGNVTNGAGQIINITFNPALFTGHVTNAGTVKTTGTTVTFAATFTNSGSFLSDPATNIFSSLQNSGLIAGGAGDIFTLGDFTNAGAFTNGGTLNVNGNITNSGNFTQSGPQTWSTTATFTNTAGTAKFQSNATLAGLTITAGTVDITTTRLIVNNTDRTTLSAYLRTNALTSTTLPANESLALLDNGPNSTLITPALPGDTNLDNHVDLTDLSTILNDFGSTTPLWTAGNFDHQSTIDLTDLSDVLNNFGASNPVSSVLPAAPEPSPLLLLAVALPALLYRLQKQKRTAHAVRSRT